MRHCGNRANVTVPHFGVAEEEGETAVHSLKFSVYTWKAHGIKNHRTEADVLFRLQKLTNIPDSTFNLPFQIKYKTTFIKYCI